MGLSIATGEYFCALASDDIFLPEKIETQIRYLQRTKEGVCSARVLAGSDLSEVPEPSLINQRSENVEKIYLNDFLYLRSSIHAVSLLWRAETLRSLGGFNPNTVVEDFDLLVRYLIKSNFICELERPLAFYRLHEQNFSKQRKVIYEAKIKVLRSQCFPDKTRVIAVNRLFEAVSSRRLIKITSALFVLLFLGGIGQLVQTLASSLFKTAKKLTSYYSTSLLAKVLCIVLACCALASSGHTYFMSGTGRILYSGMIILAALCSTILLVGFRLAFRVRAYCGGNSCVDFNIFR